LPRPPTTSGRLSLASTCLGPETASRTCSGQRRNQPILVTSAGPAFCRVATTKVARERPKSAQKSAVPVSSPEKRCAHSTRCQSERETDAGPNAGLAYLSLNPPARRCSCGWPTCLPSFALPHSSTIEACASGDPLPNYEPRHCRGKTRLVLYLYPPPTPHSDHGSPYLSESNFISSPRALGPSITSSLYLPKVVWSLTLEQDSYLSRP
jgi:hypothetical protein